MLLLVALMSTPATAEAFPYEVHEHRLDNGLQVYAVPMPGSGVVAWQTWMAVGSRDEVDEGRTGFAHFFEHLMFYGTEALPRDARERALLAIAADENAWTWLDDTVYHAVIPASGLPRLAELEADRFQRLHLTPEIVRREAGAVHGEFRGSQANPGSRLERALWQAAFTTHTYRHSTLGHERDIEQMPGAHAYAEAFFQRFYRPDHATLVVAGDLEPQDLFALVETHWGGWEPATEPRPELPVEPAQDGLREVEVAWPSPTATRLAFGWKVPAADPDSPEVAALQLATDLLLSPVGPLEQRLVREEGLALSVSGYRSDLVDPGLLRITVVLRDAAHLPRARAIVLEEVAALGHEVSPDLLDAARSHARYAFLLGLDDPHAVASTLGWHLRRGGSPDAIDRFYALYDAVTPTDVAETAGRWLVDDGLTIAVLRPQPPEDVE